MGYFSAIKMKYRLLMAVFLPSLILFIIVGKFLWDDYQNIQQIDETHRTVNVIRKIAKFLQGWEEESQLSLLVLENKEDDKALAQQRQLVDTQVELLKELILKDEKIVGLKSLKEVMHKVLDDLELVNQKRTQVDNHTELNDIKNYYNLTVNDCIDLMNYLAQQIKESTSIRMIFALTSLIQELDILSKERQILFKAFSENKISTKDYENLLEIRGAELAFQKSFADISTDEQDEIYTSTMKSQVLRETTRFYIVALAKALTGEFNVNPQEWWEKQTAKMTAIYEVLDKLTEDNNQKMEVLRAADQQSLILSILSIITVSILTLILVFINLRSLTAKLQEEIDVIAASSEEILKSISQAASGTTETATALSETTTTIEELKQTAQVAAEKSKNVADVSDQALVTLKTSENSLEDTIQGMSRIKDGMGTISQSIIKLSEHSQLIGNIIDTVNDLAEQSHLLAVNAAIEAAKAGDQGKGFSVVAQEIKSLAEQSKQATIQVRNILNDIQNSTGAAVMASEQGSKSVIHGLEQSAETNQSIQSLSIGIHHVAQAASQISLSSQQQLIGVDQVTVAMMNIKAASSQHVDHMRQIEIGVQGLTTVGQSLKKLVQECRL